jgi:hypothetical protein
LFFGNKNYLSLGIFLLFRFLSVKKFKNFKEDFTKSFFLKLNKKLLSQLYYFLCGPLAQLVEQFPFKEWVDGSSPSGLTIKKL